MQKFDINGIEVSVGIHRYTNRYCRLLALTFILFNVVPATRGNDAISGYIIVAALFLTLLAELYRMVFRPNLLVIGFDGIYHHRVGFIAWSDIEDLDFFSGPTNAMHQALLVRLVTPTVTLKYYWLPRPIRVETNTVRMDMSYSDYRIKKIFATANVMRQWYVAQSTVS